MKLRVNILKYSSYALTNPGRIRPNNEDFFVIDNQKSLYLLADGMGGHNAGEVASQGVCKLFEKYFEYPEENIKNHMVDVFKKVNNIIFTQSSKDESLKGMGATFIACYIKNGIAHLCHAGDVRAYRFRNENLKQITEDHSSVASLIKQGFITEEQAKEHPLRSRVSRAVGINKNTFPDYNQIVLNKNDTILLCSDGLWNMLDNNNILEVLSKPDKIEEKCRELLKKANNEGGKDNVTAILIEIK
jgi:PPM family protein phosphatase